jgi:hypothetical protein
MYERMTLGACSDLKTLKSGPSETNVSGQYWSRLLRNAHNAQVPIKNSHMRPRLGAGAGHSWNRGSSSWRNRFYAASAL